VATTFFCESVVAFDKAMSDGTYNVQPQQSTARLVNAVTLYMSELWRTLYKTTQ